jgi:hypothetical protein
VNARAPTRVGAGSPWRSMKYATRVGTLGDAIDHLAGRSAETELPRATTTSVGPPPRLRKPQPSPGSTRPTGFGRWMRVGAGWGVAKTELPEAWPP